eukprot:TRINITY_DN22086_c0_g1_i1.p1 TRINITY_DN22086_c0_g1~~TRINITY_DN22086_c0_g1_i1.p1  ORF type:complete len:518 (-),score=89.50 TRINITY_DN22086_c0_g1_i1:105-1592(-)
MAFADNVRQDTALLPRSQSVELRELAALRDAYADAKRTLLRSRNTQDPAVISNLAARVEELEGLKGARPLANAQPPQDDNLVFRAAANAAAAAMSSRSALSQRDPRLPPERDDALKPGSAGPTTGSSSSVGAANPTGSAGGAAARGMPTPVKGNGKTASECAIVPYVGEGLIRRPAAATSDTEQGVGRGTSVGGSGARSSQVTRPATPKAKATTPTPKMGAKSKSGGGGGVRSQDTREKVVAKAKAFASNKRKRNAGSESLDPPKRRTSPHPKRVRDPYGGKDGRRTSGSDKAIVSGKKTDAVVSQGSGSSSSAIVASRATSRNGNATKAVTDKKRGLTRPKARAKRRVNKRQSGVRGVVWRESKGTWEVSVMKGGKRVWRLFSVAHFRGPRCSTEEAVAKACKAAISYRRRILVDEEASMKSLNEAANGCLSGVRGVAWIAKPGAWRAYIQAGGLKRYSPFVKPKDDSPEELERARVIAVNHRLEFERKFSKVR